VGRGRKCFCRIRGKQQATYDEENTRVYTSSVSKEGNVIEVKEGG